MKGRRARPQEDRPEADRVESVARVESGVLGLVHRAQGVRARIRRSSETLPFKGIGSVKKSGLKSFGVYVRTLLC